MPDAPVSSGRIGRVVIVGCDEALWLAANVMWAAFRRSALEIVAVELPSRRAATDIIPTLSNQPTFHGLMQIQEGPLMAATQATYSLGQRFSEFGDPQPPFFHGYGPYGQPINRVPFHHYWVKARSRGLKVAFDDFSLSAVAARQARFFMPDAGTDGIDGGGYGYHLPAVAYGRVLKQIALQRGISPVEGVLDEVLRDAETGDITAVALDNGRTVAGDFFIDATGADSRLLGTAMGADFVSWQSWFPCDRLLATYGPGLSPLPAFSEIKAFHSGWIGLFPLRDCTAIQIAYDGAETSEQQALDAAARLTGMRFGAETFVRAYATGRRQSLWTGNCVGIGAAAAVFDPIGSVGLQAIMAGLVHLTTLFPIDRDMKAESAEYNRTLISTFERLRDFQIAPYALNRRHGQPLWDRCRDMALPEKLAYRLDLFAARGTVVEYDDETFADHDWQALLLGLGLIPRSYDPKADHTPDAEVIPRFQEMLGAISARVEAMSRMDAWLAPRPAPVA